MIRYTHPQTGAQVITSNDGVPKTPQKGPAPAITTSDIDRGSDGKYRLRKKGGQPDEESN